MSENHEVAKSTALIGGLTMVSRILGLARDMIIARIFAAGVIADCFFVAFTFPATMARLLGDGGFSISFIPVFTEELEKKGKHAAMQLAYTAFWAALIFVLLFTALGMVFAPWVVRLVAHGFEQEPGKMAIATQLTRQIFPYTIFLCFVAISMGILNSFKHFTMPAISPVLFNISMIASMLIINSRYHLTSTGLSLVIGVLAGGVLQVIVQIPTLWKYGFHFRPHLDLKHPGLLKMGKLMGMAIVGVMVYQLNVFINTFFVSSFPGGRSYIYYADRLAELPLAIFGIALGTAILPNFSRHAARNDMKGLADSLNFGLGFLAFLIIPSLLGLTLLRMPIISVIYQGSNFSLADNLATSRALLFFSLGLWASAGIRVVVPSYYSLKDARTPVICSAISMTLNLIGCALLTNIPFLREHLGFAGVCLSTAIATVVNFFIHVVLLKRKLPGFLDRAILVKAGKCLLCSIPMIVISLWVSQQGIWLESGIRPEKIIWLGAGIAVSALSYLVLAWALGLEEARKLSGIFRQWRSQ